MLRSTAITLLAIVLLASCSQEQQAPEQEELIKSVNVETQTIELQPFQRYLRLVGTVESANDALISAEVNGRIERYFVAKGDRVQKGDPILKIDDAKLLQEEARLEAQTEQAREQYDRLKQVFEQDSVGSEIELINARAAYRQSRSSLESVRIDIRNTTVKAPFDGVLESRMLDVGEMAVPGAQLVRLIGSEELKIGAGVPSRYADVVQAGDEAQVWFDFQQSDTLDLSIRYVAQSIDRQARTFRVEMPLPDDTERYKVDMITNVLLSTYKQPSAVVIGEEYIYEKENRLVVYVVSEDSEGDQVARERVVRLGPSYQNRVVIEQGLEAGDRLITMGSSFLQDQMRINIVNGQRSDEIAESS